jgi:hypothetical protein
MRRRQRRGLRASAVATPHRARDLLRVRTGLKVLHLPVRGPGITARPSQARQGTAAPTAMKKRVLNAGARGTASCLQDLTAHAARERFKWKGVTRQSGPKQE